MRVTIVADDGVVGVAGVFRPVDLSGLDSRIHAVQWDTLAGAGEVEFKVLDGARTANQKITDFTPYQPFHDAWTAAAPPAPTLDDLKAQKAAAFMAAGVARIAAQVPDWDSLDTIKTVAGLWASHLAANATAAQIAAKEVYLYLRDTVPAKLAAVPSRAELDAIDVGAADPFGDGTVWPA